MCDCNTDSFSFRYTFYTTDPIIILNLTQDQIKFLESKKIYFTFAYFESIRCYKHNQLIWEYSSKDVDELVRVGRETAHNLCSNYLETIKGF